MSPSRCVHLLLRRFNMDVQSTVHANVHTPAHGIVTSWTTSAPPFWRQSSQGRRSRGVRRVGRRTLTARTDEMDTMESAGPVGRPGCAVSSPLRGGPSPWVESGELTGWPRMAHASVCIYAAVEFFDGSTAANEAVWRSASERTDSIGYPYAAPRAQLHPAVRAASGKASGELSRRRERQGNIPSAPPVTPSDGNGGCFQRTLSGVAGARDSSSIDTLPTGDRAPRKVPPYESFGGRGLMAA